MADSKPLKINADGLRLLHKNLEEIGQEMDMVVDEEPHEIEAVDDDTEKIIKENVIDKTKRILRPEERKRFLAVGQILMDEWLTQIRDYQANEKKVGLLTGAISMLKKKIKSGVRTILNIFKWHKEEKKERKTSGIVKLLAILAGIGITAYLFWDDIKETLPKEVTDQIEQIGVSIKEGVISEIEKRFGPFDELWDKSLREFVNIIHLDEIWTTYVETYMFFRGWATNPWQEFRYAMGIDKRLLNPDTQHHSKEEIEKAKEIISLANPFHLPKLIVRYGEGAATTMRNITGIHTMDDALKAIEWAYGIMEDEEALNKYEEQMQAKRKKYIEERQKKLSVIKNYTRGALFNTSHDLSRINEISETLSVIGHLEDQTALNPELSLDEKTDQQASDILNYLNQIPPALAKYFSKGKDGYAAMIINRIQNPALNAIENFVKERTSRGIRSWFVGVHDGPRQTEADRQIHLSLGEDHLIGLEVIYQDFYDRRDFSIKRVTTLHTEQLVDEFDITFQMYDGDKLNEIFYKIENKDQRETTELKKHNEYLGEILSSMEKVVSNLSLVGPEYGSK